MTTRWLASRVDKVFLGFGEAVKYLGNKKNTIRTGNPIREIVGKIPRDEGRNFFEINRDSKVILILGGSQGAAAINKNILRSLSGLPDNYHIIWHTGERDYKE
ncbi:MAG: UDP-N-acetylglucosamine--N-acetylmuramyl-(pentapeptide) pyrophosphoryl-undecaprenol N-acetylglucosamine transferase, partial [Acidobacteria bacterium]|nr:UDP-N-acetylglucosamine--N-acetylmuramyl-(pentapeptide) pyrophosphoryl-undecaprenol N-acetylglucosamine transferase [Acidobacteriota bacterium]